MANYGIKYISEFDRLTDAAYPSYTFQILQKEYTGAVQRLTAAAAPVVHRYDTDEPKPPIKGGSLEITLINEGSFPLRSIYSTDDEEFKAKLIWHGPEDVTMFEGFVVQDDCSELMADWNHEITIAANDNLGLLKDVAFNKAPASYDLLGTSIEEYSIITGGGETAVIFSTGFGSGLIIGDKVSLDGEGPYEIRDLQQGSGAGGLWNAYLVEDLPSAAPVTAEVGIYRSTLLAKITLLSVVKRCLSATGLQLNTHIFSNINESSVTENTTCFLEQTLIDPQSFYSGDKYDDCYQVLEKLFTRFNFTLFQAKGVWNIVRWPEARTYDYDAPGYIYDSDFILQPEKIYLNGKRTLDEDVIFAGYPKFLIGIGEHTVAETGLTQRIIRPLEYVKETFNYKKPDELLKNSRLDKLGSLLRTEVFGIGDPSFLLTYYEYEAPWWFYTDAFPTESGTNNPATYFIRVVKDYLGNEVERYMVVQDNDIHCYPIEVNKEDIIKFSFNVNAHGDDFSNIAFFIKLTDGTNTVYAQHPEKTWDTTTGDIDVSITAGVWTTVEIETGPVPFDGLLTVYLRALSVLYNVADYYNSITLEIKTLINKSTKVIGHTHTSEQPPNIKNNDEHEIFMDSSPRNFIIGTLYLDELVGLLNRRAVQWKTFSGEAMNLGELITAENLFIRKESRTILEGSFYGLTSTASDHISMLNVCRYAFFELHNFIAGRLEIDYRNNHFSGTLYEMYKDNEADSELTYNYTFEYLYDAK